MKILPGLMVGGTQLVRDKQQFLENLIILYASAELKKCTSKQQHRSRPAACDSQLTFPRLSPWLLFAPAWIRGEDEL